MGSKVKQNVVAALVATTSYALITVIVTHPVAWHLSSAPAGFEGQDALQYVWSLWWAKTAVVDLHTSPANVTALYAPVGAHHPILTVTPYLELSAIPLVTLFGPVVAYNLHFLLSFVLTGLTTYLLCIELSGDRRAAFIAGLIFAFCPHRMGHAIAGHLRLIAIYWVPLYALFLIRVIRKPTLCQGLLCGLFLGLSSLVDVEHIADFVLPVTIAVLAWQLAMQGRALFRAPYLKAGGLALLIAVAITAPFFVPFLAAQLSGELGYLSQVRGTVGNATDLLAFITPSPFHPLLGSTPLGDFALRVLGGRRRGIEEGLAYLGLVPAVLAVVGFGARRKEARLWALLGGCAAILSLGPCLKIGGQVVEYTFEDYSIALLMPYALVKKLPFYKWGRAPGRLNETVVFCVAILAAYGIAAILSRVRWRPTALLPVALSLITLFEYSVIFPFPASSKPVPNYYRDVAADAGNYAILDLPVTWRPASNYMMYYQTVHQHPIVGGYITRYPPGELTDFVSGLVQPNPMPDIIEYPSDAELRYWLRAFNIGKVIIHKDLPLPQDVPVTVAYISQLLGEATFEDDDLVVFDVPEVGTNSADRMFALSTTGWQDAEMWGDAPTRWLEVDGQVYLYQAMATRARIRFTAYAHQHLRHLEVSVNGKPVGTFLIHDWQTYVTDATDLGEGLNVIRFRALEGCTDFVGDPRCLCRGRFADRFGQPLDCDEGAHYIRCLSLLIRDLDILPGEMALATYPIQAHLGDSVTLLGYDLAQDIVHPGDNLILTLYWEATAPMDKDYTVFVHVADEAGYAVAQNDAQPVGGRYPTSVWRTGTMLGDRVVVFIPPDTPVGEYQLRVGMYLLETMERLPVTNDASGQNAVALGMVRVKEP